MQREGSGRFYSGEGPQPSCRMWPDEKEAWADREPPWVKAGERGVLGPGPAFKCQHPLKEALVIAPVPFTSIQVYLMSILSCRLKVGLSQEYEVFPSLGLEIEIVTRDMLGYWITQKACGKLGETPNLEEAPQSVVPHGRVDRTGDFSWDVYWSWFRSSQVQALQP